MLRSFLMMIVVVLFSASWLFARYVCCADIEITSDKQVKLLDYIKKNKDSFTKLPDANPRSIVRVVNGIYGRIDSARSNEDRTKLVINFTFLQLKILSNMLKMIPDRQLVDIETQIGQRLQFIETKRSSSYKRTKVKCVRKSRRRQKKTNLSKL